MKAFNYVESFDTQVDDVVRQQLLQLDAVSLFNACSVNK